MVRNIRLLPVELEGKPLGDQVLAGCSTCHVCCGSLMPIGMTAPEVASLMASATFCDAMI